MLFVSTDGTASLPAFFLQKKTALYKKVEENLFFSFLKIQNRQVLFENPTQQVSGFY